MAWIISKALMRDFENSRSLPEQAVESLADTCSDGEPSALSNMSHTQQAYCSQDRMTEYCRLSRFGMTFAPLTESHGEALLTWYLADSRARTSALQAQALAWMASDQGSGQKWRGSLAKFDPATFSLKTAQCSLFEDSTECCVTLPRSGTMRSGVVYQREKLALHTIEIELGSSPDRFPTPTARDYKGARSDEAMAATGRNQETNSLPDYLASIGERGQMNPVFREWLMGWPLTHTDLKPLETARFLEWQQQHSIFWQDD